MATVRGLIVVNPHFQCQVISLQQNLKIHLPVCLLFSQIAGISPQLRVDAMFANFHHSVRQLIRIAVLEEPALLSWADPLAVAGNIGNQSRFAAGQSFQQADRAAVNMGCTDVDIRAAVDPR